MQVSCQGLLGCGRGRHTLLAVLRRAPVYSSAPSYTAVWAPVARSSLLFSKESQTPRFFGLHTPHQGFQGSLRFCSSFSLPFTPICISPASLGNLTRFNFQCASGYFPPSCVCICYAFCSDFPAPPTPSFPWLR